MVKLLRVPVPSSTRIIGWPPTPFCRNANGSVLSGTASFLMISVPDAGSGVLVGVAVGAFLVLTNVHVTVLPASAFQATSPRLTSIVTLGSSHVMLVSV